MEAPFALEILLDLADYRNGILHNAGGWRDQPSRWAAAVRILDCEVRSWESLRLKEHQDKARRSRGGR